MRATFDRKIREKLSWNRNKRDKRKNVDKKETKLYHLQKQEQNIVVKQEQDREMRPTFAGKTNETNGETRKKM